MARSLLQRIAELDDVAELRKLRSAINLRLDDVHRQRELEELERGAALAKRASPGDFLVVVDGFSEYRPFCFPGERRSKLAPCTVRSGEVVVVRYAQPRAKRLWVQYNDGLMALEQRALGRTRGELYKDRLTAEVRAVRVREGERS